jgi:hypothetical protein
MTAADKLNLLKKAVRQQQKDSRVKAALRLQKAGILTKTGKISPIYREAKPAKAK